MVTLNNLMVQIVLVIYLVTLIDNASSQTNNSLPSEKSFYPKGRHCNGPRPHRLCRRTTVPPKPVPTQPSCSCGVSSPQKSSRIVGGSLAKLGEFPWRCIFNGNVSRTFCTCTIISASWVMTAAHCMDPLVPSDTLIVDVGDLDFTTTSEAENVVIEVDRFVRHPTYDNKTVRGDIALVHLKTPITFTPTIQPVCLPFSLVGQNLVGRRVTVSGWGSTTDLLGPASPKLMKADVTVVSNSVCRSFLGPSFPQSKICTREIGKSVCSGDSGGGIDLVTNERSYTVGVSSSVINGCNSNSPNVFTRVASYLDWIVSTTGEQFCQA